MDDHGVRLAIFLAVTLVNTVYSWNSLHDPRVHGFYRFFVFEGIVTLLMINGSLGLTLSPRWLKDVSQLLNAFAILSVLAGYYQLRRSGGHTERVNFAANHPFENTARLVTSGIYRYIRHPMYSSLLLFSWGLFLGYPTLFGAPVELMTTVAIYLAARVEERENTVYFGNEYLNYMKTTRMFIPYIV